MGLGATPGAVLALESVQKRFRAGTRRIEALRGVSLAMREGVVMGLVGPDGAGKTTLMRLAAGLLVPDAGRVTVLGLDAARDALAVQAQIGYMPQRFGLYEDLSVQENLDLYADLQGVPRAERPARYRELMEMTGLGAFTARLAGRLSGGMKQKLGLACTLVRAPRLLVLDEPTVGVDPVSRRELWAIVYRLVRSEGTSVLLSTAYLDEAERCDEVALLHDGEVLAQGAPAALTEPMRGRAWAVYAPGAAKRALQAELAARPGVTDALIQGERLRLVTEPGVEPRALLAAWPEARAEAVAPRFEDAFVARLRERAPAAAPRRAAAADPPGDEVVIEVRNAERRFGDFYAVRN
nr:ABC transporter ATP-binding protein [Betaproteobacteria bacterium]